MWNGPIFLGCTYVLKQTKTPYKGIRGAGVPFSDYSCISFFAKIHLLFFRKVGISPSREVMQALGTTEHN